MHHRPHLGAEPVRTSHMHTTLVFAPVTDERTIPGNSRTGQSNQADKGEPKSIAAKGPFNPKEREGFATSAEENFGAGT